ncbi:hypothetical protein [Sphingomonas xinjiangensis]|uniref:Uncharacterized protein n=1 Tax=Sphingomonas xinjiangensis TaxID=643568 RepID=A0A840YMI8_9SPHN|nr:hypothetical protein [Sphingomonas xinjiangensis]MBB5710840.1 hypothetical protein [Sphingomonas xinjiangensis]
MKTQVDELVLKLGRQIADLREATADIANPETARLLSQLICHFEVLLADRVASTMDVGREAEWWSEWKKRSD